MKILLSGFGGFMGKEVIKLAEKNYLNASVTMGVDAFFNEQSEIPCVKTFNEATTNVDLIVQFSHHTVIKELLEKVFNENLKIVEKEELHNAQENQQNPVQRNT